MSPREIHAGVVPDAVRRAVSILALAAVAAGMPFAPKFAPDGLVFHLSAAVADSGNGKDGDDQDDDDDTGRDDDDNDDDDDDDDEAGSDDGDGNSGRGGGKSGGNDRDDGRDDDRGNDDRGDRGDGEAGNTPRGGSPGNAGGSAGNGDTGKDRGAASVARVEASATSITVTYRDGMREILANGTYRRVDAGGTTLEQRHATGADLVRLRALAAGRVSPPAKTGKQTTSPGHPAKIHIRGRDVTVTYTNGWTEKVERGRYRLTDRYGHVAVKRAATENDRARLMDLAGR